MIVLITCIILLLFYYLLIAYYEHAWTTMPVFNAGQTQTGNSEKISVIIPARNEEANIAKCLEALLSQDYPATLLEIIVVNDHSTDDTAAIVETYREKGVILVHLEQVLNSKSETVVAYKKKAIEAGIAIASGTCIVTTDADCTAGSKWISTVAAFKTINNSVFIAAPVKIVFQRGSLLLVFQSLDFAILQGITGASVYKGIHNMCNGANLAYDKKTFYRVNGFAGIDNIASGDDMLLMHKIKEGNSQLVHYLKSAEAIVSTQPAPTWRAFFQQRIRWASKSSRYNDIRIMSVLVLVYCLNLGLLILLLGGLLNPTWWLYFTVAVFYKTIIEWCFVKQVLDYFNMQKLMVLFPFFQPLHITYIVVAGFLGNVKKYEWKGRKVK